MIAMSPKMRISTSCVANFAIVTGWAVCARKPPRSTSDPSGFEQRKSAARISSKRRTSPFWTARMYSRLRFVRTSRSDAVVGSAMPCPQLVPSGEIASASPASQVHPPPSRRFAGHDEAAAERLQRGLDLVEPRGVPAVEQSRHLRGLPAEPFGELFLVEPGGAHRAVGFELGRSQGR